MALAKRAGERLTRQAFLAESGMSVGDIFRYWPNWSAALVEAGAGFGPYHERIPPEELLRDWGKITRKLGQIPTRNQYKLQGHYSPGVLERNYGPWSSVPSAFRMFAADDPEWRDVFSLLPSQTEQTEPPSELGDLRALPSATESPAPCSGAWHRTLYERPTYGDPIDFRGLRHAPVNESGVVLLFGMVARELGYLVEAVQAGFPDCEAKRQTGKGRWQRVRVEFEFESRNFRDHNHDAGGCDIIVCWCHNWPECPKRIEVLELQEVIKRLSKSEE